MEFSSTPHSGWLPAHALRSRLRGKNGEGGGHHQPLPQYTPRSGKVKKPVWNDERDALALHDRLLALHGGAVGLRDDGLLKSALARPQQHFAYAESPDIVDMAAAYTWGIVRNHPFVDGNKRTGFVVGVLFLEVNGYRFNAREEDAAQMVLELASGNLDEAGYTAFLRAHASLGKKMKQHFRAQRHRRNAP